MIIKSITPDLEISYSMITAGEEFSSLFPTMIRNRLVIRFEDSLRGDGFRPFMDDLARFCNNNFTGLWLKTIDTSTDWDNSYLNQKLYGVPPSSAASICWSGSITLHCESPDDLEKFKKDYAVLIKLGQV